MRRFVFLFALCTGGAAAPLSSERVVLKTDLGDLVLVLYPHSAPKTVKQFLRLVRLGVYDSTYFFRVHPGFVAQVSDAYSRSVPLSSAQKMALEKIPLEIDPQLRHTFGTLSMAHYDGDPNSNEVSFSILLGNAPHLDGRYTIFGKVEEGRETLASIQQVDRNGTTPSQKIFIRQAVAVTTPEALGQALQSRSSPREVASVRVFEKNTHETESLVLLCIAFVAAIAGFLGTKLPTRFSSGLHLLTLLIAVFGLTLASAPALPRSPYLGAALCAGLLLTFRLFSRFESQ